MSNTTYDLIVLGAGPGGYVAAIRAAQLGMTVAVVESRATLGGVCLNEGCIPSKALLDSSEHFALARDKFANHGILIDPPRLDLERMMKRKDDVVKKLTAGIKSLFKKHSITWLNGTGSLGSKTDDGGREVKVKMPDKDQPETFIGTKVLLATGSKAAQVPSLPFDGEMVFSAREALSLPKVPDHLLVVGGGYIGLELGSVWLRLGAKVTVVEMLPHILPNTDREAADLLQKSLQKQGMTFRLDTKVTGLIRDEKQATVTVETKDGKEEIDCDAVLVAVGRTPLTADIGLEQAGVELDPQKRIKVDNNYRTSAEGIYAIGDLIAGPMLAHKAMEEGVVCVERMTGKASEVEYDYLPGIIYTWPEIASVGPTEEQLKEQGTDYKVGKFPFIASGRAKAMDETEGFVKILADPKTTRLLAMHIIGPRASDMIAEGVTAMSFEGSARDLGLIFHAHPTLSEAVKEAALDVLGEAVHK